MNVVPLRFAEVVQPGDDPEDVARLEAAVLHRLSKGRLADAVDDWSAWEITKELQRMRRWGSDGESTRRIARLGSAVERRHEDWEETAHLGRVRRQSVEMVELILRVHGWLA